MTAPAETLLSFEGVSKKFRRGELHDSLRDLIPALMNRMIHPQPPNALRKGEFWALRDVSFAVGRGEAVGVIGENGAGKSTILKLLTGIIKPTDGVIRVKGRVSALIEVGAGFHPDLTGRENIFLNGTILGMTKAEIRRKFDAIVDFSGLGDFIDTPVKRYSSGMYARLGFSVAVHVDPDVLIVDEVLSVGDYVFQRKCTDRMFQIVKGGATVVFVSHNLHAVNDLCHRTILLHHGQVARVGPTSEVVREYLDRARERLREDPRGEAFVSDVQLLGADGREAVSFRAGDAARVAVEVSAHVPCEKLSLGIQVYDEDNYNVFNTATERLGLGTFDVAPGRPFRCVIDLTMHLGEGTYYLGLTLHRYDIQRQYDRRLPAETFFVRSEQDVRGAANLYPRVTQFGTGHPPASAP